MASVITIAGEQLFALKAQQNEQLDIDTFIFANVPGQDPAAPINRAEGIPTAYIVHQQTVQQVGRINENVVVYSTVLSSTTGPFDFNWVGLYSSVNNKLVAINHVPTVTKTITVPGSAGNTLNRNFGIEYSGIAELTGITVEPETWQLDFTARLTGMDMLTQQLAEDMNGKDWFIEDGFKVEPRTTLNTFKVTAGAGYVSGLRVELETDHILTLSSYPQFVYVDAWFAGTANSIWKPKVAFTVTNSEMDDYIDTSGVQHYVYKLAIVHAADNVEDLREENLLAKKEWVQNLKFKPSKIASAVERFFKEKIYDIITLEDLGMVAGDESEAVANTDKLIAYMNLNVTISDLFGPSGEWFVDGRVIEVKKSIIGSKFDTIFSVAVPAGQTVNHTENQAIFVLDNVYSLSVSKITIDGKWVENEGSIIRGICVGPTQTTAYIDFTQILVKHCTGGGMCYGQKAENVNVYLSVIRDNFVYNTRHKSGSDKIQHHLCTIRTLKAGGSVAAIWTESLAKFSSYDACDISENQSRVLLVDGSGSTGLTTLRAAFRSCSFTGNISTNDAKNLGFPWLDFDRSQSGAVSFSDCVFSKFVTEVIRYKGSTEVIFRDCDIYSINSAVTEENRNVIFSDQQTSVNSKLGFIDCRIKGTGFKYIMNLNHLYESAIQGTTIETNMAHAINLSDVIDLEFKSNTVKGFTTAAINVVRNLDNSEFMSNNFGENGTVFTCPLPNTCSNNIFTDDNICGDIGPDDFFNPTIFKPFNATIGSGNPNGVVTGKFYGHRYIDTSTNFIWIAVSRTLWLKDVTT